MREERFDVDLEVDLDENELALLAEELAEKIVERDRLTDEIAAFAKPRREKIKELDESASALAKEIDAGATVRAVSCIERANHELDRIEVVRLDTGAVVRERAFEHDERQLPLEEQREPEDMPEPLEDVEEQTAPV